MDPIYEQPSEVALTLSTDSQEHLRTACTWARFLAILGFISSGLIVLGAIATFLFVRKTLPDLPPRDPGVVYDDPGAGIRAIASIMPVFYLIVGAMYFWICTKLYRFGTCTRSAIDHRSDADLETGVKNLGSFFKTFGIFAVMSIVFYLLVTIGALGTLFARM